MKTKKLVLIFYVTILLLSFLSFSCNTYKKSAVACREFSISKNYKAPVNRKNGRNNKIFYANKRESRRDQTAIIPAKNRRKSIAAVKNSPSEDILRAPVIESVDNMKYSDGLIASIDNVLITPGINSISSVSTDKRDIYKQVEYRIIPQQVKCDTIVLKSGVILAGKVEEIGLAEIKYRRCDNISGPLNVVPKSYISIIHYSNGTSETFTPDNKTVSGGFNEQIGLIPRKEIEVIGIIGFVFSLLGIVPYFGLAFIGGIIGIIFGFISLARIHKYSDKFRGKRIAGASILIGLAVLIFWTVIILKWL